VIHWWLFPTAALSSLLLTGLLRRYALARSLIDHPNERSSHTIPTPRGGGLAIALVFLAILPLLGWWALLPWDSVLALLGGGALVAAIGFLDDHGHVPARWRLLIHFVAAAWMLAWLGGLPPLPLFGTTLHLGWVGHVLAAIYLVWLINLYNFMDGIDGIAGIEAITLLIGAALMALLTTTDMAGWYMPLLLGCGVGGFLYWNYPPAKIFMGDVGSGFLGLMLGGFSIYAAHAQPELFWAWLVLLGIFIVDATLTLVRRVLRGEKFYEAHRSHAYQHAARIFGAHRPVSLGIGAINVFWLFPIATTIALRSLDGFAGLALAYAPLLWLAFRFKAGEVESEDNTTLTKKQS